MVKVTDWPEFGVLFDAETEVVVPTRGAALVIHAGASASRFTDPSPVTRSYPVPAA